ncbi:MAG: hypothetical protein RMY34_12420 [Aulosira sp. DedQUE10]|nr:hypothetical protein [Aulosira sp. DedQUE10]
MCNFTLNWYEVQIYLRLSVLKSFAPLLPGRVMPVDGSCFYCRRRCACLRVGVQVGHCRKGALPPLSRRQSAQRGEPPEVLWTETVPTNFSPQAAALETRTTHWLNFSLRPSSSIGG